ncbi:hypothetical protein HaLaN_16927 [Haematococcus lacustris]|uniref:Uncharacterized protein n=1 Tax=Haematococcus lacustris TaxID=44745 RepID=A0A699ZN30_HAELA|nr:hypothetical protein HaLaN_16927 [Haematococcus lacustris]
MKLGKGITKNVVACNSAVNQSAAAKRGGAAKVGQEDASSQDFSWRQLEHDSVAWPSDGKHGGNGVEQHPT